jgi:hypothetical protein
VRQTEASDLAAHVSVPAERVAITNAQSVRADPSIHLVRLGMRDCTGSAASDDKQAKYYFVYITLIHF